MFDPALAGYWGSPDLDRASDSFIDVIAANAEKIDGVKLSLLDKDVRIAAEMMHDQHMSTPVIDLVANLFTAASKTLGADADYIEVSKYLAAMNGEDW